MWCVFATGAGREELIRQMCKRHLNNKVYSRCMFPLYEQMEHYRGAWHTGQEKLFPGYLFLNTKDLDELVSQLKKEKIMAKNDKLFVLTPEDVTCLSFFMEKTGVFPMSRGIIVDGRLTILSGPLVGEEDRVIKVDRHKRRAWLQIKLFGKPYTVVVGLEIPQKTAQEENSSSNTSLKARTDRTSAGVFHKKRKNYRKKGNAKERHSYRNFTSKSC